MSICNIYGRRFFFKTNDIIKLYNSIEQNSMIVGSRYLKGSRIICANKIKVFLSHLLNYVTRKILSYQF